LNAAFFNGVYADTHHLSLTVAASLRKSIWVVLGEFLIHAAISGPDAWISDLANNPFAGSATDNQPLMWADFTPVPVPAAVWLFGSGLVGLVGMARRKKTA